MTRLDCGIGLYEVGACLGRSWKDRRLWLGRGRDIAHAEGARRVGYESRAPKESEPRAALAHKPAFLI